MRHPYIIVILFFVSLILPVRRSLGEVERKKHKPLIVRVLLDEKHAKETSIFTFASDNGIMLYQPKSNKTLLVKQNKLKIITKNNGIYVACHIKNRIYIKKCKDNHIQLKPIKTDKITVNEKTYQGNLHIQIDEQQNALYLINHLNLDDYLYAVLISEIYQTWPKEMHKIQAVVSRSYALHHILQTRKKKKNPKPYDVKRSNFNQTYNGHHHYTHLRQAIEETKGLILTYNNAVALTMFDACCGGIIPSNMKCLDFKKAPYLARSYACHYCKNYRLYKWKKEIPYKNFLHRLKHNHNICHYLHNSGTLKKVLINKRDKAGIINRIKLSCARKNIIVSGQDLWDSLRDSIKSLNFIFKNRRNSVIIEGKGFGHQIGLCQRGARELVNRNWHFRKILKYYYPNTRFARIHHA